MLKIKKSMIVLFSAGMVFLTACGNSEADVLEVGVELLTPQKVNYNTLHAAEKNYRKQANGPLEVSYLVSEEVSWKGANARYQEALVGKGDEVKKGDVLVTLNIEENKAEQQALRLQLTRMREETEKGKAELLLAIDGAKKQAADSDSHERRIAELTAEKLQIEYEKYVHQMEEEIAGVVKQIEEKQAELENNKLLAPFDGVIDTVTAYNEGDLIKEGQVLLSMHATEDYLLKATDTTGNLRYNMEVTVESSGKSYKGRVISATGILPGGPVASEAMIRLDEKVPAETLKKPIRYLCYSQEVCDVLLLDRKALNKEEDKWFVYVLDGTMVQKRYVTIGLMNAQEVWVLDGISAEQTLIVN